VVTPILALNIWAGWHPCHAFAGQVQGWTLQ